MGVWFKTMVLAQKKGIPKHGAGEIYKTSCSTYPGLEKAQSQEPAIFTLHFFYILLHLSCLSPLHSPIPLHHVYRRHSHH